MTKKESNTLRNAGLGYKVISKKMCISVITIKTMGVTTNHICEKQTKGKKASCSNKCSTCRNCSCCGNCRKTREVGIHEKDK